MFREDRARAMPRDRIVDEARPIRILIVEDDEVDRIAIRRTLSRYGDGVHLQEVSGAADARAALASHHFDCALLDQRLPDGDGMDLVREIASRTSDRERTAVVVLTGVDDESTALLALSEGADDYLIKGRIDDYALLRSVRYATERRRSEALRGQVRHMDRLAALGTLAAGVAHEINNPLACVIGNLSAIDRTPRGMAELLGASSAHLPQVIELCQMMDECLDAAERVARIVKDLRTLARADGDDPPTQGPIEGLLDSATNIVGIQVRRRAQLVKAYGATPPVTGNGQRLVQVFVNLLVNAGQAIPEGSPVDNEVRITTYTDAAGRAVVEVSDTGTGIPPEDRPRLFEPFFTTKDVGEGTGLGLSTCWGIVTALGGEITFEPREGARGTTFRVCLPAAGRRQRAARATPVAASPLRPARRHRVLIIDDEPPLLKLWASVLSRDHEVAALSDAREALRRIAAGERFDVIIVDVMMPLMSGKDFHAALGETCPEQQQRILMLTGGSLSAETDAFLESMKGRWLQKPITPNLLREQIEQVAQSSPQA